MCFARGEVFRKVDGLLVIILATGIRGPSVFFACKTVDTLTPRRKITDLPGNKDVRKLVTSYHFQNMIIINV